MTTTDFFTRPRNASTATHTPARGDLRRVAMLLALFALAAVAIAALPGLPADVSSGQWHGNAVGHAMK